MASISDSVAKLVADRILMGDATDGSSINGNISSQAQYDWLFGPTQCALKHQATEDISFPDLPLDFDFGGADELLGGLPDTGFPDLWSEHFVSDDVSVGLGSDRKRKAPAGLDSAVRKKKGGEEDIRVLEGCASTLRSRGADRDSTHNRLSPGSDCSSNSDWENGLGDFKDFERAKSEESTDSDCTPIVGSVLSGGSAGIAIPDQDTLSAEHHFEQMQRHAELAIAALRRGHYGRTRNIVSWAHDLKNKTANEVKKEAEQAWETDKAKERMYAKPTNKKQPGSSKRVEQFRKNMRRWMIGVGMGVEWMVWARMEHLLAIASFILGPATPADPASCTAVTESLCKYLGRELPEDMVETELAEPEPGKRYAIGAGLVPLLEAKQPRKTSTLAFTMPSDDDEAGIAIWRCQLEALFPKKPAPKGTLGVCKA